MQALLLKVLCQEANWFQEDGYQVGIGSQTDTRTEGNLSTRHASFQGSSSSAKVIVEDGLFYDG